MKDLTKHIIAKNYLQSSNETDKAISILLERGVVIKIDSYTNGGVDYHNYWGVILSQFKDNGDYRVYVKLKEGLVNILHLPYNNIKWVIGTKDFDCVNIGAKRHNEEVISLISKALKAN